jgi:hypothetical protein
MQLENGKCGGYKYCECDNVVCVMIKDFCRFSNPTFSFIFGVAAGVLLTMIFSILT